MDNSRKLISEAALRCGDPNFQDFPTQIYEKGLYRANRDIAKRYEIFYKAFSFFLEEKATDINQDIIFSDLQDFKNIFSVNINGKDFTEGSWTTKEEDRYYWKRNEDGDYVFNYNACHKNLSDSINIIYSFIPHSDITEGIESLFIPPSYEEEQISLTICFVAKLGITKFAETEKKMRYKEALTMYTSRSDKDKFNNTDHTDWACIQVYQFL